MFTVLQEDLEFIESESFHCSLLNHKRPGQDNWHEVPTIKASWECRYIIMTSKRCCCLSKCPLSSSNKYLCPCSAIFQSSSSSLSLQSILWRMWKLTAGSCISSLLSKVKWRESNTGASGNSIYWVENLKCSSLHHLISDLTAEDFLLTFSCYSLYYIMPGYYSLLRINKPRRTPTSQVWILCSAGLRGTFSVVNSKRPPTLVALGQESYLKQFLVFFLWEQAKLEENICFHKTQSVDSGHKVTKHKS